MATEIQKKISEMMDIELLRILEEGETIWTGQNDEDGQPIMVTQRPSAAKLAQINSRLKQLGLTSAPVTGTVASDLVAAATLRFKGEVIKPLPPVSLDDEVVAQ